MKKYGFTLIELLVVIAIMAVVIGFALVNLASARSRARDSKTKADMQAIKNALRLYYNDYQRYPSSCSGGIGHLNIMQGCGESGDTCCYSSGTALCTQGDFAAGGESPGCDTVYMKKFPTAFGSTIYYFQQGTDTDDYYLRASLENTGDPDLTVSQSRCATACGGTCTGQTNYYVCAD